jgi:hypothetical protein
MDRDPSRRAWLFASVAPFFALAIFRPWVREAFPVWDYPDVLSHLRRAPGLWNGAMALAEWNRADGRAAYLTYLQFSFGWNAFGDHSLGWQMQSAMLMLAIGVLLVTVARRLGATPIAAGVAALVFTIAVPSTEGWFFMAAEPLATTLLLLMVLAAAGYATTPNWRRRAVLIAALAAGVMLTKEFLGLCLPMVVLLAVCWDPKEGFRRPALGPRERWLALLLVLVNALEGWNVLSALRDAVPGSYASAFGRTALDAGRAVTLFQAMLLPTRFSSAGIGTVLYPANFAFLLLLFLGLAWGVRGAMPRRRWWWPLGLLSFPAIGAVAYALWPRYSAFYGIPFFAASAGLLALAGSCIERTGRAGRLTLALLGGVTIFFSALVSARTIRHKRATADLAVEVSRAWPSAPHLDSLFVVTPRQGGRRWPVNARELRNYAVFMGVPDSALPVMRDTACEDVVRRLQIPLGKSAVLNDQNPCGRIPDPTMTWSEGVDYLDWTSLRWIADTMRVDLHAPAWTRTR